MQSIVQVYYFCPVENKKVTIHQLAAKLNLSASTISRALSDHPRIGKETRELVKRTAEELNYKPNTLASNLRKGKGKLIGVIIPRINRNFFSYAIAGMESVINPAGYSLMICQTNENVETEKSSFENLINNRVDGIIMSVSIQTTNGDYLQRALKQGVPIVQFDRVLPNIDVDKVLNDNLSGAYQVTKHLLEQGYRNIVHFTGPLHLNIYADRLEGYKNAMIEAGIEVTSDMVFENALTREEGERIVNEMIAANTLPDAIFAASDFSALGALLTLKKHKIEIPGRVGIAGFANEPFTELTEPGMTSVEQHSEELGKTSARILIDRLESNTKRELCSLVSFKPKLIIRESSLRKK